MITIKEIDAYISNCLLEIDHTESKKQKNKIIKKLNFYKLIRSYLQSEPSEIFIKKSLEDIQFKISIIKERFPIFMQIEKRNGHTINQIETKYFKDNHIPLYTEQVKALKFLLKK